MTPLGLRVTRRFRCGMSLLLAAVLALSPMLSTAAQTHEASHAAQGAEHFHSHEHGVSAHAEAHATPAVAGHDDEMPDAGGMLHSLAHAAHACAHAIALLDTSVAAPGGEGAAAVLPAALKTLGDAPRVHPFRPPIA